MNNLFANKSSTEFIEKNSQKETYKKQLDLGILKSINIDEMNIAFQENSINYEEPIIRFVDHLIKHAFDQSASDIHIEPYDKNSRIRYRQNGILYEIAQMPANIALRLVSRLKVMAKLDIAERRLPQDGRIQFDSFDIRINTCPTLFGEKIVLRVLNSNRLALKIDELGFTENQINLFLKKISQPQGLILVTGPTGSGKTVTLYSALNYLNTCEKNISTVEDPIEIQINGINQVNINQKINLDFSTVLRTFLRQDPDIIMLGEIRDYETAEIAIQAAQTGHLVLSTLHTNSALETIDRLRSIGIRPHTFLSCISLIIGQRLIRTLCNYCKRAEIISYKTLKLEGFPEQSIDIQGFNSVGCQHCLNGFISRIGLYEMLTISEKLSQSIMEKAPTNKLLQLAESEGFLSLKNIGVEKIRQGVTSLAEVNRVIAQ